ncbi:MAG: hypothetical protein NT167_25180 [Verrucomicrobia bacterium]|nr:hypothetical protein [Verrucomicrobiota bacterium]
MSVYRKLASAATGLVLVGDGCGMPPPSLNRNSEPETKRDEIGFDAEGLVGSVEAFAAQVQGQQKLTLRTNQLSLPAPIKPIGPEDITALRQKLNVSQAVLAGLLNVPKVTAISWDSAQRSALKLTISLPQRLETYDLLSVLASPHAHITL